MNRPFGRVHYAQLNGKVIKLVVVDFASGDNDCLISYQPIDDNSKWTEVEWQSANMKTPAEAREANWIK
ncbi:hypothetical protein D3C81_645160 [compost metagenome]